ncbi:ester cyclase [Natrialbaceae archaeon A-gly3]
MTSATPPETDAHPYLRLHRTEIEGQYRRFIDDVVTEGRLEVVDDLVGDGFVTYTAGDPEPRRGPEGLKAHVSAYHRAFPDLTCDLESVVVSGPHLAGRWTMTGTHERAFRGLEPTGARVTVSGVDFVDFEDGTFRERWELLDTLTARR